MDVELILAPEVDRDLAEAYDSYEEQRPGQGEDFPRRVDACLRAIRRTPEMHATVHLDYRRALIRKFPHAASYE